MLGRVLGYYGANDEPLLSARVLLSSANFVQSLTFLVDTGADRTCMSEAELFRFGEIPQRFLNGIKPTEIQGVTGSSPAWEVDAVIFFLGTSAWKKRILVYRRKILILPLALGGPIEGTVNLLGRDITKDWICRFDQTLLKHSHAVRNCDAID